MIFAWDVGSSVTYAECKRLAEIAEEKTVLEIGSWLGRSTIALASTAEKVIAVDWHHGDFYAGEKDTEVEFRANLERYEISNVEVIVAKIEDVWRDIAPGFDLTFIDADHTVESTLVHWDIAKALTRPDGLIALHDYGRFGVTEVVDAQEGEKEFTEALVVIKL